MFVGFTVLSWLRR